MTATDDRHALAQFAGSLGWERKAYQRVDVYIRGLFHVHVMWRGSALNGGSHYDDSVLLSYSRDLAKVQSWLAK